MHRELEDEPVRQRELVQRLAQLDTLLVALRRRAGVTDLRGDAVCERVLVVEERDVEAAKLGTRLQGAVVVDPAIGRDLEQVGGEFPCGR